MENSVRTAQGALLQDCQRLGKPMTYQANTTLNQKFAVQANTRAANTDVLSTKYAAIGNGGHRMVVGTDNTPLPEPVQHRSRDCALFNHLPFIVRRVDQDLTADIRIKYRMRKIITVGGVDYAAYYLKVLDLTQSTPTLELRSVLGNTVTSTPFIPTLDDLNPAPPALNSGGVLTTTGDYIAATAKVPFALTAADIDEFKNVSQVLYNSDSYAIISEIALCSGVDKSVTGTFNGTQAAYTEVIDARVTDFINTFFPAKFSNSGMNVTFDTGVNLPMLQLT